MFRFRKFGLIKALGGLLLGVCLLSWASPTRADFILTLSQGATSTTVTQSTDGTTLPVVAGAGLGAGSAVANSKGFTLVNATIGDYNITTQAATNNSPGTTFGQINLTNTTITLIKGGVTTPLVLTLETTGAAGAYASFTAPPAGPATLVSTAQAQQGSTAYTVTFQSSLDGAAVGALQKLDGKAPGFTAGNNEQSTGVVLGASYNLKNETSIAFAAASKAGSTISNVSGTTQVEPVNVVPAPAGIILALTGIPCLGVARWLRRRRK